jgi:hypothetical protein
LLSPIKEWKGVKMKVNSFLNVVAALGIAVCLLAMGAGCKPSGPSPEPDPAGTTQSGQDDHGHAHEETGPHGGHIVEIGDEQLHAEWTHNDASGEVVVYLLDSTAKSDAAISAGTILITTKIGDAETSYELTAASQEGGETSKFALSDPSLVEALKAVGPGIEATIVVQVNDENLVGTFEAHSHGGHQH